LTSHCNRAIYYMVLWTADSSMVSLVCRAQSWVW